MTAFFPMFGRALINASEAERSAGNILTMNLIGLEQHIRTFAAAVALYDLCSPVGPNPAIPQEHVNTIRIISGSTGAMTIYNAAMLIQAIRRNLHEVPTLRPKIDTDALKQAEADLKQAFPHFEPIRHAAAHPAELFSTMTKARKNSPVGEFDTPIGRMANEGGTIAMVGNFMNRTYFSTIDGEVVQYDLSDESLAALARVATTVYSAFAAFA